MKRFDGKAWPEEGALGLEIVDGIVPLESLPQVLEYAAKAPSLAGCDVSLLDWSTDVVLEPAGWRYAGIDVGFVESE